MKPMNVRSLSNKARKMQPASRIWKFSLPSTRVLAAKRTKIFPCFKILPEIRQYLVLHKMLVVQVDTTGEH